jgi:cobalt-zinc-cadmium efflux system outer membrane protein
LFDDLRSVTPIIQRQRHWILLSIVVLAGVGCAGWRQPKPEQKQLEIVNGLFNDRTQAALDVMKLLQTDPCAPVPSPTGTLTSEEAVQRAVQHNLSLVASAETLPIAQANLVQAGLLPNPTFGQTGAFYFPLSGQGGAVASDFLISETFNGFFAASFKVAIAKAQRFQASIDIANQAFGLAQETRLQFERLASLLRSRQIQERIAQVYKQAADDARTKVRAGLVTNADVNRATIQYESAQCQARHYQSEYEGAATQMNWLMGVQSAPQWKLPDSAKDSPSGAISLPTAQALEELALKYRMDLLRASFDHQIAKGAVWLARLGTYPATTIGFDAKRDSSRNWTGGPNFQSPLQFFDPGIVGYWLAEYGLIQTERTYAALQGQVRQDVRNALNALQIADEDVRFYKERMIPQEEENVREQQLSFRRGNAQFDDLLNTLREYQDALQAYESAIQAYQQSVVGLETAVGLSFGRIEEMTGPSNSDVIR